MNGREGARADSLCAQTGSPFGPFPMQAYEYATYQTTYARTLELAGFNRLFSDLPSFALPALETGPRAAGNSQTVAPYIPPVLLKSIAYLESGWAQADYTTPYGSVGPTLVSPDCGYGIMQVTTGMENISGVPTVEQAMIGGHYAFNVARGAQILADKWNHAPDYLPMIGARDPTVIENWYYALWAYNGFAFQNHPLNPAYSPTRLPYSCGPLNDGYGHDRSQYPYQELVMGCVARPPSRNGSLLWPPQATHLPDLTDPTFAGPLSLANWTPCSYNFQCGPMDMPTPNPWHQDPTSVSLSRSDVMGSPATSVSTRQISLQASPGQQSLATNLSVTNSGTGVLAWAASPSVPWIKLSAPQGVSLGSDLGSLASSIRIYVDATGLPPGNYTGYVAVQSLYGSGAPLIVNVSAYVSLQTTRLTGDFNGDGKTDVAFLCCGDSVSVWFSNGDGTFAVKTFSPWPGYNTQAGTWKAGDFNGDGKTDLIHICCSAYAETWLSNGDGTFGIYQAQAWPGYGMQGTWVPGDFNGDKRTDLAHMSDNGYWNLWTSSGGGTFRVSSFFAWPGYDTQAGSWRAADVTGDGKDDLVHFCCQNYLDTWISDGHGGFALRMDPAPAGVSLISGDWSSGDFNGDGKKDLLETGSGQSVRTWFSKGDGTYTIVPFTPWPGYGMAGQWLAGDFNADGKDDVLHLCCSDYAEMWTSNGNGSYVIQYFRPWPGYGIASGSWESGDFNGDKRKDFLHFCCYYVNIWTSAPTGGFTIRSFFP